MRLSTHFVLLDFLYSQSILDCVAHCNDLVSGRIDSLKEDSEEIAEGRYLCASILDPIVERHGPISIAGGLWFNDMPAQGRAFDTGLAPHRWKPDGGAAADIAVHSWVNRGKYPSDFPDTLPGSGIEYNRVIPYSGPEFLCLASRLAGNKYRPGNGTWDTLKKKKDNGELGRHRWKHWRRKPYAHAHGALLRHNAGYDSRLLDAEAHWTADSMHRTEGHALPSVVYGRPPPKGWALLDHSMVEVPRDAFEDHPEGGLKLLRPWHVRVSDNFVLLDFCRNEKMFERGIVTVPPLTFGTANSVIKVARMFGEILDPVKAYLGNISVVRGMEPEGFAHDKQMQGHRWLAGPGQVHSVEFVTPLDPRPGYLERLPQENSEVSVSRDAVYGGDRVRVSIRDFTPRCCHTSAISKEYAWTR